jgi:N-acetylglucosaminyldiphosphoundecaprenol N-acetyl-beta-D-mannosaminyltransferase
VIDHGKRNVLGILIDAVDYDSALKMITEAARKGQPFAVSALAVHGVMTGVKDRVHRHRLTSLDLVTPDGQPVRWALNWLYRLELQERVYGPELMFRACDAAAAEQLRVYLYGSTPDVLLSLQLNLDRWFPGLVIAGAEPSRFRELNVAEIDNMTSRIIESGAQIVFVGLGCPRQEVFVYELRERLPMPLIAVGAAFDYHAGRVDEPPTWMQDRGLQWAYRLAQDPLRLWRRYLLLNPLYLLCLMAQALHIWRPDVRHTHPPSRTVGYG